MKLEIKKSAIYLSCVLFIFIWVVRGFSGHYEAVEYNSDMLDYVADSSFAYNLLYILVLGLLVSCSFYILNSRILPKWFHFFIILSILIGILYFIEGLLCHNEHLFPLARAALNPMFLLIFFMVFATYNDFSFQKIIKIIYLD